MTLLTTTPKTDTDLARRVATAIAAFEADPERRALAEREQALRGALAAVERALSGASPPMAAAAEAVAAGREPARPTVDADHTRRRLLVHGPEPRGARALTGRDRRTGRTDGAGLAGRTLMTPRALAAPTR